MKGLPRNETAEPIYIYILYIYMSCRLAGENRDRETYIFAVQLTKSKTCNHNIPE